MKTIQITILAEDIKTTSYFHSGNCAITRALKRANINATNHGVMLRHDRTRIEIPSPSDLDFKVRMMYTSANPEEMSSKNEPQKPEDFTYDLEVPDNWID